MQIHVKLSATLRTKVPDYDPMAGLDLEADTGISVAGILERLSLLPEDVKVIMVNGRSAGVDTVLGQGDRVGLFPAVGGG